MTLHPSLVSVLEKRGIQGPDARQAFLSPVLDALLPPSQFSQMPLAVEALLAAIQNEQPIGIYADRDVDGLCGLAILARTLRTLGGLVHWANPVVGRGVERAGLESLTARHCRLVVLIDCGAGESTELAWLRAQNVQVIVADHHRLGEPGEALAWIHPATVDGAGDYHPAGCGMAFKLAHALWLAFIGPHDPSRLDYFLYDHLDVLALGILADRVPLTGENRTYVWHGLRRLPRTRKTGLATLLRFFRLIPRAAPITVREATWRLIPLLNAAGRLHRPEIAADLLLTENADRASECLDQLLALNSQRRTAQDESLACFQKAVQSQCDLESDRVLVALAENLEPNVTGLAAQAIARHYERPVFLFVRQGDFAVGSARGIEEHDLYAWVHDQRDLTLKFGGHAGAVGLTLRVEDIPMLRTRLLTLAQSRPEARLARPLAEATLHIAEADLAWWQALETLGPFGPGFEIPVFELTGVERRVNIRRKKTDVQLLPGGQETLWAVPVATPKSEKPFEWMPQEESYAEV
jgi:single-stranded-DNA-specific exonuclease